MVIYAHQVKVMLSYVMIKYQTRKGCSYVTVKNNNTSSVPTLLCSWHRYTPTCYRLREIVIICDAYKSAKLPQYVVTPMKQTH